MKRAILPALLACFPMSRGVAAEGPVNPPLPSPTVPPATVAPASVPIPIPEAIPAAPSRPAPAPRPRRVPPKIVLGEKQETDQPDWKGVGIIDKGKFTVKATPSRLTAVVAGAADSHSFYGVPSVSVSRLRLAQEFEIRPGVGPDPRASVTLSARLDGYIRVAPKGTACLKLAGAAIYPACGVGPPVGLSFPPHCVDCGPAVRCEAEDHTGALLMPPGPYLLVADLVLETSVNGPLRDQAEAIFAPGKRGGVWFYTAGGEPGDFEEDEKEFGLTVNVTVAPPP